MVFIQKDNGVLYLLTVWGVGTHFWNVVFDLVDHQ